MQTRTEKLLDLLEKNGPSLHGLLTRLTLREDVAEDLMQELFIKLNQTHRVDTVDNLPAYVRTVAMNLAFDWRRKRKEHLFNDPDDVPEPAAEEKDIVARMVEHEQLQQVLQATERLSKTQRHIFVLRYLEQRSFEQISQDTGKTPHHIRAICSRALTRVRELCSKTLAPKGVGRREDDVEF